MNDTFLLNKISESLKAICDQNNMKKIEEFTLVVNHDSHINEETLHEYLKINNKDTISEELKIEIEREEIEVLTAIIKSIKGQTFDKQQ